MTTSPIILFRTAAFALLAAWLAPGTRANNIQVSNIALIDNGTTAQVQFDISWENSWRVSSAPSNWDAAWIFVKYWNTAGICQHVKLSNTGQVAPAGGQIDLGLLTPGAVYDAGTNPAVGAFLYRNADGTGVFSLTGVQLRWDYGALGLSFPDIALVQVYAIEMVYVPQGAFAAGGTGTEGGFPVTTINTAVANTAPSGTGSLGGQAGGYPTGQPAPAASFPNGYNAYYCMKYEISQQGYVDFLNTLNYTQQATRTVNPPDSPAGTGALVTDNAYRNGIDIQTPGVAGTAPAVYACNLNGDGNYGDATDGQDIACAFLTGGDVQAYLDWSGLRPMSELEYEKACRGPLPPVANEFPWGNTTYMCCYPTVVANAGAANETFSNFDPNTTNGRANTGNIGQNIQGPLRVGSIAAHGSNSGRVTAGASYYSIMELAGNTSEATVNVNGSTYSGTHGDGTLTVNGDQNVATWPGGFVRRGGGWFSSGFSSSYVASRYFASGGIFLKHDGGRGVRTAP